MDYLTNLCTARAEMCYTSTTGTTSIWVWTNMNWSGSSHFAAMSLRRGVDISLWSTCPNLSPFDSIPDCGYFELFWRFSYLFCWMFHCALSRVGLHAALLAALGRFNSGAPASLLADFVSTMIDRLIRLIHDACPNATMLHCYMNMMLNVEWAQRKRGHCLGSRSKKST